MSSIEIGKIVFEDFSKGDTEAFGTIYTYFKDVVSANILKIIHRHDIMEDILQDTFIKLWENRSKLTDKKSVESWLFRVSYHTSVDHIRAILRARQHEEATIKLREYHLTVNQEEIFQEFYYKESLLQEAINILPPQKRQVFELCKLQGKSYSEVSGSLNIAHSTVKDYITESNKIIKKYIMTRYSPSSFKILLVLFLGCL